MSAILTCGAHGRQPATLVCRHIVETVADGEPRGFFWNVVDGSYEAICAACNALSQDEFADSAEDNVRELCFGCFRDAAAINGVHLE
ncbi:MAG: hypothetical protein ACFB00_09550 [Parvularculaceae bacterium]